MAPGKSLGRGAVNVRHFPPQVFDPPGDFGDGEGRVALGLLGLDDRETDRSGQLKKCWG